MKTKLLFLAILLRCTIECFSQIPFCNKNWEKCKVPIVVLNTSLGNKLFIVDTGSTYSFIDQIYADKFCKFYRNIDVEYCSINGVELGRKTLYKVNVLGKNHLMIGLNIKNISQSVYPYEVIGILGADFLSANKITINFNNREVTFNN